MKWLNRPALVFVLLVLLTALMLSRNWDQPFYKFDDHSHIKWGTEDPWTDAFRWDREMTYFPVSLMSFRIDRALCGPPFPQAAGAEASSGSIFGPSPITQNDEDPDAAPPTGEGWAAGVRVINGLYHALAGLILLLALRRLGAGAGVAVFVALVWTGHPMACESVCWISERKNVLAALFSFGAILAWTAPPRLWRWPVVNLLFIAACLSKPTGVTLLPILVAVEILFGNLSSASSVPTRERGRDWHGWVLVFERLAVPVLITAAIIRIGMNGHRGFFTAPPGGTLWTALLTDVEIFTLYVFNILLPVKLSFFYGITPIVLLADARLWLYGLPLAAFFAASILLTAELQRRLAILGTIWFFGGLGSTANLLPIPYWMQDRFAYFSTAGLLLTAALLVDNIASRLAIHRMGLRLSAVVYVCFIAALVTNRSPLFKDSNTLMFDAANKQPASAMAQICAGKICRFRFRKYGPSGAEPDPRLAYENGHAALRHFTLALNAPDLNNFMDTFTCRIWVADLLCVLGDTEAAREFLKGWLPPSHLQMYPRGFIPQLRTDDMKYYAPQALAYAWLVMGEASLRDTGRPGLTLEEKTALFQRALEEADKSLTVHIWEFQSYLLKARILIATSDLDLARGDMESAKKHFADGVKLLQKIPAQAESFAYAKFLLENIKPPEN